MKTMILVGAYPPPYGGVAEFCRRTVDALGDSIELFICRTTCNEKIKGCNYWRAVSLVGLILKVLLAKLRYAGRSFHFNFSHSGSLPLFVVLPGTGNDVLTLHNGEIDIAPGIKGILQRAILRRFGTVHAINAAQAKVYQDAGCRRIVLCSTYLRPNAIDQIAGQARRNVLASGYFLPEYKFDWLIEYAAAHPEVTVSILGYGQNLDISDVWKSILPSNVTLIPQCTASDFLQRIVEHDIYVRMNTVDSMGIAVCDALHLGVRVVASDVCDRPKGTVLFATGDKLAFFAALNRELGEVARGEATPPYDLSEFDAYPILRQVYAKSA